MIIKQGKIPTFKTIKRRPSTEPPRYRTPEQAERKEDGEKKFLDVNGEEIEASALCELLIYRQRRPVATVLAGIRRLAELSFVLCWRKHARVVERFPRTTCTCGAYWRYYVKEGILMRVSQDQEYDTYFKSEVMK